MANKTKKELEHLLRRERAAKKIIAELNNFTDLNPTLNSIVKRLKKLSRCEAAGIRLKDENGNFPFVFTEGFEKDFLKHSSPVLTRELKSSDKTGNCHIHCMCGNVIKRNKKSASEHFTKNGSFFTNNAPELHKSLNKDKNVQNMHCINYGFQSIAIIPISYRRKRIGILQFNDRKENKLHINLIKFLEMMGIQIGIAIQNSIIHDKLRKVIEETKILRGLIPICANCKKVRDDKGYWSSVEEYITRRSEADFSHGICPECLDKLYPEINE